MIYVILLIMHFFTVVCVVIAVVMLVVKRRAQYKNVLRKPLRIPRYTSTKNRMPDY